MAQAQKSILFTYPRFNDARDPTAGGAENRTAHLLQEASQEYDVSLLQPTSDSSADEYPYTNYFFRPVTPEFLTDLNPFYWLALYRLIHQNDYDLIQVESLGGILVAILYSRLLTSGIPVIYGSHNIESERVKSVDRTDQPLYKKVGAPLFIPALEWLAVHLSDHIISVSDRDRNRFCTEYTVPEQKVTTIRSGTELVDADDLVGQDAVRKQYNLSQDDTILVFHGTYENFANREAIESLYSIVYPVMKREEDSISIVVAGKGVPEMNDDDFISVGYVPDLYSFLNAMDIAVVPITSGAGTKLKLFDYMAVGLPIVATEKATEGIEMESSVHALITKRVDSRFLDAIYQLVANPSLRKSMGEQARELAESEYRWSLIGTQLRSLYGNLLSERASE